MKTDTLAPEWGAVITRNDTQAWKEATRFDSTDWG